MNLNDYYWSFVSAVPPKLCDDIIKFGLSKQEILATTGGFKSAEKLNKDELKN